MEQESNTEYNPKNHLTQPNDFSIPNKQISFG